jgi:hypothetical protein
MAEKDNVRTPTIALIGFLSAIVVFAIIVLLQVMYYWSIEAQRQIKVIDQPSQQLADLVSRQQAKLNEYRWVDEKQWRVAIPINRAMQLTVEDLAEEQRKAKPEQSSQADRSKEAAK